MIPAITELNFPKKEGKQYATLTQATVDLADMGERTITATVKIDGEISPDFSFDWEVEFRGEKYVHSVRQPQAIKDNASSDSSVNLTFEHWAVRELKRWMFHTVQPVDSGTAVADKYVASVSLNLGDFVDLFSQVLKHHYGDAITISLNPYYQYKTEPTTVEISHSFIWDVLLKLYELYKAHWRIEKSATGYVIKVGYAEEEISHVFEYGFEGGLMKVERQVQNTDIRNLLIGRGGEKNLPYRYFKNADPNNPSFKADPDWVKELENIYFDRLRGATFRSYIQGWKAHHINDADAEGNKLYTGYKAVGEKNAYAPWAYRKGYTDTKFDPVEYVGDKIADSSAADGSNVVMSPDYTLRAVKDSSLDKYGPMFGGLDDNDDIYPTLQGVSISPYGRIDQTVYIEQIASDEVEPPKTTTNVANRPSMKINSENVPAVARVQLVDTFDDGRIFTVSEGQYANFDEGVKSIELWENTAKITLKEENGSWNVCVDRVPIFEEGNAGVFIEDARVTVVNVDTHEERSASGIPAGRWAPKISLSVYNSTKKSYKVSVMCNKPTLMTGAISEGTNNTFDVWIKNIWQTTKNTGETDEQYVNRVWHPILGVKDGGEAKLVFASGWLSTSEDYEFAIVNGGVHYDTSKTLGGVQSHWRLTLAKSDADLESTGLYIPSTIKQGNAGDYFFFTGIDMQHVPYVTDAEVRLDDWKKDNLLDTADIKPTWVVTTDRVKLNGEGRADALIHQLVPGCVVTLKDKRFIPGSHIETLYLQSVKITYRKPTSDDNALNPDVDITLGNDYIVNTNPISQLQGDVESLREQIGGSISNITGLIRSTSDKRYLRKDKSDRTPYKLSTDTMFEAGTFVSGFNGTGAAMTAQGLIESDRMRVRSALEVYELIINQQRVNIGDNVYSSAADTIETVEKVTETDGTETYNLTIRKQYDEYQTSFVAGDIMRGMINTLGKTDKTQNLTHTAMGYYYTSWMRVNSVNAAAGTINVSLFADSAVPGAKNYPPCPQMNVVQRGFQGNADMDETETDRRQSFYEISLTDGGFRMYKGVNTPNVDKGNYGIALGRLPEFCKDLKDANGTPVIYDEYYGGLYAKTILYEKAAQIDFQGKIVPTYRDRGEWDKDTTYFCEQNVAPSASNPTGGYYTDDVWHFGCKWRNCKANNVGSEPKYGNPDWAMIEGNPNFTVDFYDLPDYLSVDPAGFSLELKVKAMLYNRDITDSIIPSNVTWIRYSEFADGTERVNDDTAWNSAHGASGKTLTITEADCGLNGYIPKTIRFTATVLLPDGSQQQVSLEI